MTDKVIGDMQEWPARPLDAIYPVVLIDALVVKVRDGQVANRPVYVAAGIDLDGRRDVLGLWVGPTGGEGAKQWMNMLTELRNRGVADVYIVCCDGLKGLPDAIGAIWPLATMQTCVVNLVRNSLRYASKKYWSKITSQLREWLAGRAKQWLDGIEVVAMDGFSGFKTAAAEELPYAVPVVDPFHVVRLAGDALDWTAAGSGCSRTRSGIAAAPTIRSTRHAGLCIPGPACSPTSSTPASKRSSRSKSTSRSRRPGASTSASWTPTESPTRRRRSS